MTQINLNHQEDQNTLLGVRIETAQKISNFETLFIQARILDK